MLWKIHHYFYMLFFEDSECPSYELKAYILHCHQVFCFHGVWEFTRLRLTSVSLDFKEGNNFAHIEHPESCSLVSSLPGSGRTHRGKSLWVFQKSPLNTVHLRETAFVVKQLLGCSSLCVAAAAVGERTWHPLPFSQLSKSSYILMFTPEHSTIYSPIPRPLQHMSFCELWSFLGLQGLFMFEARVPAFLPF